MRRADHSYRGVLPGVVYVCVWCVYVCVGMCVRGCGCVCARVGVWMCVRACGCVWVCVCARGGVCVCVCVCLIVGDLEISTMRRRSPKSGRCDAEKVK